MTEPKKTDKGLGLFGFAALGLIATGIAGILHAFHFGDGTGILAAAIAFGVLYYPMVRMIR